MLKCNCKCMLEVNSTFSNTWEKELNKILTSWPRNTATMLARGNIFLLHGKETMLQQHPLLPFLQNSTTSIKPELQPNFRRRRKKMPRANLSAKALSTSQISGPFFWNELIISVSTKSKHEPDPSIPFFRAQ